uniref:GINM1 n=1 Tax=Pavo cristatus TaxID=9049 RepID=A0A8C9FJ94_PAVCR
MCFGTCTGPFCRRACESCLWPVGLCVFSHRNIHLFFVVFQETIRVNVMMLKSNEEFHRGQVVFNITYVNGQVYLNDFPMRSGVAHITCQTVILENASLDDIVEQQRMGTVSVRIMVHEWPLASSSDLQLIVIQEEVTEIDGRQVQQEEVTEIDILVKDLRVLRHSNYTVPLKESMLYSIPRDNDMLFTLPNLSGKGLFLRPHCNTAASYQVKKEIVGFL